MLRFRNPLASYVVDAIRQLRQHQALSSQRTWLRNCRDLANVDCFARRIAEGVVDDGKEFSGPPDIFTRTHPY